MSILDTLLGRNRFDPVNPAIGITLPWSDGGALSSIVWNDLLGADADLLPISRAEAIMIPAVSKARNLLVSTVAKFPLRAIRPDPVTNVDVDVTALHPFLFRTNSAVSPYERMAWTIDDGIFHGVSLWLTERGDPVDGRRPIQYAAYCPWSWWWFDEAGRIRVREDESDATGRVMSTDEVILFNFPFEGLLNVAARTLRGARDTERAWVGRVVSPIPMIDLHRTDDVDMTDPEVRDMVNAWATARMNPNGAIGSTPAGIEPAVYGDVQTDLYVENRNAVRTDVGSFLNVRASMLDGTMGIDSLTYTTVEGERNSFYEFDLPFWTDPVEARLSLDDVVPRGQRVRFDKYGAGDPTLPTGPPNLED